MSEGAPYRGNGPTVGISAAERDRLHRRLDELLDVHHEIAEYVDQSEMSDELANRLQHHAERLVIRASRFAGEVAGGDARAIAFRHPEPTSRQAFSRFLNVVAEYAAPYAYAALNLGIDTFTWTDAMAVLDDLRSLEYGDTPPRLRPSPRLQPKARGYPELCENWRAIQWVAYLTAGWAKGMKDAAKTEVAAAYGVSTRALADWVHKTETISNGHTRTWTLENAGQDGEADRRPHFTRAPYRNEQSETWKDWLNYDAEYYKMLTQSET